MKPKQKTAGMTEYTKWWIAHPWHTTKGMAVPPDCDCEWCAQKRTKEVSPDPQR